MKQRQDISQTVEAHGAEYQGDLTKAITHLIAAAPGGKKYEYAKTWGVKVVALEWLKDSVERGMALDETFYDPLQPPEQRGIGAWSRNAAASVALGKRTRDAQEKRDMTSNPRKKLRRAASSRLGSGNLSMWAEITAGTASGKQTEGDEWNPQVEDSLHVDEIGGVEKYGVHAASATSTEQPQAATTNMAPPLHKPLLRSRDGVFQGRTVFIHGLDEAKVSPPVP